MSFGASQTAAVCPACHLPNACARAVNPAAANCWCFAVALAPELLAHLRKKYPAEACLCRDCLAREKKAAESAGL